jgi:DNA-binding response OmpR family regulator
VNNSKILLVEDDINLGYILKEYIELHGFSVTWAKNGEEGLQCASREEFHLMIVDVVMPRMDGFELARIVKEKKNLPIIFLTAKSLLVDKLKGFKIGADDYMVKPVEEEELIARIEVILKRHHFPQEETGYPCTFEIGQYHFDFRNQKLMIRNDEITLTSKEAELLRLLCLHQEAVLDRKEALGKLWNTVDYFSRRNMDVFITRLRKHLSRDPSVRIVNIHSKGFMLKVTPVAGEMKREDPV